jgi:hypothetical protein
MRDFDYDDELYMRDLDYDNELYMRDFDYDNELYSRDWDSHLPILFARRALDEIHRRAVEHVCPNPVIRVAPRFFLKKKISSRRLILNVLFMTLKVCTEERQCKENLSCFHPVLTFCPRANDKGGPSLAPPPRDTEPLATYVAPESTSKNQDQGGQNKDQGSPGLLAPPRRDTSRKATKPT